LFFIFGKLRSNRYNTRSDESLIRHIQIFATSRDL